MRKFALVSPVLPPDSSGQSLMLYRLLKDIPPDRYCLLTKRTYSEHKLNSGYSEALPAPCYQLPYSSHEGPGRALNLLRLVLWTARIVVIARREQCEAIIACTAGLLELPCASLASRLLRLPFYAYLFDDYVYQWQTPASRRFAEWAAPWVLRGAAGVIAPNEFLAQDVMRRFDIKPTVIHNPCDLSVYEQYGPVQPATDEVRIVYTGSVYQAHCDAFRNLLKGIATLGRKNVKLHLYTANTPEELEVEAICGPVEYHPHQHPDSIPAIQCSADILFLALAFESAYPHVLRTAAPGKLGEYLAARRPILAHVPRDSYVAWYCDKYECGVVVDQADPVQLASALAGMLDNQTERDRLAANGWARAKADFSISEAQTRFVALLSA